MDKMDAMGDPESVHEVIASILSIQRSYEWEHKPSQKLYALAFNPAAIRFPGLYPVFIVQL